MNTLESYKGGSLGSAYNSGSLGSAYNSGSLGTLEAYRAGSLGGGCGCSGGMGADVVDTSESFKRGLIFATLAGFGLFFLLKRQRA